MSNTPQGPGWKQASDGKWYPPAAQAPPGPPTAPPTGPPLHPPVDPPPPGERPPPPGAPAPGGSAGSRRPFTIVALVSVAVIVAGGLFLLSRDDGSDAAETDGDEQSAPTDTTEPPAAADPEQDATDDPPTVPQARLAEYVDEPQELGDDLVLLEYGVSSVPYRHGDDEFLPTIGLLIENTGDEVRHHPELRITFFDEDDNVLTIEEPSVYVIQPGEVLGIGFRTSSFDPVDRHAHRAVVDYGGEGRAREVDDATLVADDITTELDQNGAPTTRFEVTSTYSYELDSPISHAVYRNADGRIIGGDSRHTPDYLPAEGTTRGEVGDNLADFASLGIDLNRTEIYVDPGYSHG